MRIGPVRTGAGGVTTGLSGFVTAGTVELATAQQIAGLRDPDEARVVLGAALTGR